MLVDWELGFRGLFHALVERDEPAYERILAPESERARALLDELGRFRNLATSPPISTFPPILQDHERERALAERDRAMGELSEWYALSRVLDYLLLSFSPPLRGRPPGSRKARQWRHASGEIAHGAFNIVSASEYRRFAAAVGLEAIDPVAFSPIHSEIVEVVEDESVGDRIVLEDEIWPGLRFGELIVARGGAVVRAARHVLAKPIAETSTLHATYWRSHRPTNDCSRGWGSNSQWKTIFRRDYLTATHRHYNVDGYFDVDGIVLRPLPLTAAAPSDLTRDQRIALVTHRCVVVGDDQHVNDRWVYDATYVERM
ncbi:MAG TPA: hypothetical protein VMJ10_27205 [Kofleriaceae bacterium]|nr:hypothetical protein [Kofleriaceae bacterium]